MGLALMRDLQSGPSDTGADTRPTGEYLNAGDLAPGTWFDLNSGSDAEPVPVRVVAIGASHQPGRVRVDFVTVNGDSGHAHLSSRAMLAVMGDTDFEEEEW